MRRPRRLQQRGAVAVEFALVLPLFLLLVLGGIDWGYYFFVGEIAANAAREGARAAALDRTVNPCLAAVPVARSYMRGGGLIASDTDGRLRPFDTTCPSGAGNGCCELDTDFISGMTVPAVRVRVVYQARPNSMSLTGFLPPALLPRSVVATATMRREP